MKTRIHLFTALVVSMMPTHMMMSTKQPVLATKDKGVDTKAWTIGIYDQNNKLIPGSENVVFAKNTKFLSGKGKKLYFDFSSGANSIYVYKDNAGAGKKGKNLAEVYNTDPSKMLKSDPLQQNDAPEKSEIRIQNDKVVIIEPVRTIPVMIEDSLWDEIKPVTVKISKTDGASHPTDIYQQAYYKTLGGNFKDLELPVNKDFYIILEPKQGVPIKIKTKITGEASGLLIEDKQSTKEYKGYTNHSMHMYFYSFNKEYRNAGRGIEATFMRCKGCESNKYTFKIMNSDNIEYKDEDSLPIQELSTGFKILIPRTAAFSVEVSSDKCTKTTKFKAVPKHTRATRYEIKPDCSVAAYKELTKELR